MTNLDIEYAFRRLEQAIQINDTDFILESCYELVKFDELPLNTRSLLFQLLSLCNLKNQCFLKSYQSISNSIELESTANNQLMLDILKAKISE